MEEASSHGGNFLFWEEIKLQQEGGRVKTPGWSSEEHVSW